MMMMNKANFPVPSVEPLVIALAARRFQIHRPFGSIPAGNGKLTDVAVAADGTVYALTRRDHYVEAPTDCVNVFDRDGRFVRSFGAERIIDAHKIACDPQDNLWVVDRDAHEIVVFDQEGRELRTLGTRHEPGAPFNHPSDLAFSPDGSIWVADGYGGGHIHKFAAEGTLLLTAGSVGRGRGEFLTPHGIAVLSDGRPVVADRENGRVQLFSTDGECLAVWDQFYRPSSVWIDAEDTIHVCDAIPTLTALKPDGTVIGRCRPSLNGPHGMCGATDGTIYLAETNPHRLTRLTPIR